MEIIQIKIVLIITFFDG